jgi:hypothetical protein
MLRLILSACVMLFCAMVANADMISGPFTTTTPIPYMLTDWTGNLSFPMFDSSLGTLTEVDLALSGSMNTVLTVHNRSQVGVGSTGWAKTELQVSVVDASNLFALPQIDLYSPRFEYTLGPGDSTTSETLNKSASSNDQYSDPAVLAEFTGPGIIMLSASTFTQTMIANTGCNTDAWQVTQAELTGTVTYHYSVPEPSTIALLCTGAVGLLAFAWRRRA